MNLLELFGIESKEKKAEKEVQQAKENTQKLFDCLYEANDARTTCHQIKNILQNAHNFDYDMLDKDGDTLLHAAVYYYKSSSWDVVNLLIENGAKTTAKNSAGQTAYEFAKENNLCNYSVLERLSAGLRTLNPRFEPLTLEALTSFPLINSETNMTTSHYLAILKAIERGDTVAVDDMPNKICNIINEVTIPEDKRAALAKALTTAVTYDKRNADGDSVLHALFGDRRKYYKPYAKVAYQAFPYLRRHADINGKNNAGLTPLGVLCSQKPFGYPHQTPFAEDLKYNKLNLEALVEAGADVHLTDNDGNTPLHLVVMHNNFQYVPWLLEIAPELAEVKNNAGKTAEQLAPAGVVYAYANLPYWEAYQTDRALSKINKKDSTQKLAVLSALAKAFPQETQRIAQQLQQTTPQREVRERE